MDQTVKTAAVIRPIVICLFRNGSRILVAEGFDPIKNQRFLRPLGGAIEFGETGLRTLEREMAEELGQTIEQPVLLGALENIFTFNGQPGHEIVLVYDARFQDKSLYQCDRIKGGESDGSEFRAFWLDIDKKIPDGLPLYPDGLLNLIHTSESRNAGRQSA